MKAITRTFAVFGLLALLLFGSCWTTLPWRLYYWLSMPDAVLKETPAQLVILGGGGIPSETGLMRTYFGAATAAVYPQADVIVALPGDASNPDSAIGMMRRELVARGVAPGRIVLESRGTNTRSQAIEARRLLGEAAVAQPLLIVTSPEHMRRAVLTFRKAGWQQVGSMAAFDAGVDSDLQIDETSVDDQLAVKSVEGSVAVRYEFWNHLTYLTRSARELTALAYYKLKGWV
jgi:uncharacterized SAM-binding protein YcdF (DUF218 family)